MANMREIKGRIKSAQNIRQITTAMKLVASARVKRAQERILGARPYAFRLADVIGDLALRQGSGAHPLLSRRTEGPEALFLVTADRGLCGSFNANLLRRVQEFLRERPHAVLLAAGKKGRDFLRRRGFTMRRSWVQVFPAVDYAVVAEISREITAMYTREGFRAVHVLYNEFKSLLQQRVVLEPLLPVRVEALPDDPRMRYGAGGFLFEPDMETLLSALLPRYVAVEVRRILLESFSAEMAARRNAMEAASKNAGEMIGRLTLEYNRVRQAAITKEIMEIVGGAEALK